MSNSIIHIGYPKTATTWFQKELYPKVINLKYIDVKDFRSIFTNEIPFVFDHEKVSVVERFGADPFLVCDEGIIGGNPYVAMESISRIHRLLPDSRIVLFIRNQLEMISSKYSQYVYKNMGTMSANSFISKDPYWHRVHNFQRFHPEYLCYDKVIAYLINLFGSDNLFVYFYEDFLSNPNEFINGYLKEQGLVVEKQVNFSPHNEGLRKGLYPFIRFMNIFTRYNRRDKYYLIHIPYWFQFCRRFYKWLNKFRIFGKKPEIDALVSKKQLTTLNSLYQRSNSNLIRYLGREKLIKYNYPLKE